MWLRKLVAGLAVLAFLALGAAGCSDDAPAKQDAKVGDGPSKLDTVGPRLDHGKPDFLWPDLGKDLPTGDLWPNPTDTYSGTPFGCTVDADCFGLKCCTTPWGVKVCAKVCN